ncbi:hypothetical protein BASA81_005642 [Batrachochytrium salamandrivorans]|nr:hypothetical protein BASA81_005642 [Batrachochytrium salamandrivorans]
MTAATLSPTTPTEDQTVEAWVCVAVFVFLFFISYYISKFIIAFLNGFSKVPPDLIANIKLELQGPLAHALRVAFLTLAFFFLPVDNNQWFMQILYYLLRFYQWIVIFYSCINVSRVLITLMNYVMEVRGVYLYVRQGIVEFLYIIRFVMLVIVFLILVSFFPPNGNTDAIISIFLSVNMVTATLIVMIAPLMRSLISGLSLLVDQQIKTGEVISLPGICKVGKLKSLSLRQAEIESFEDGSVLCIPAVIFSRNSVIKCNSDQVTITAKFPVPYDMPVENLRELMEQANGRRMASEVWLDQDFCLVFDLHRIDLDMHDVARTELILNVMNMFQQLNITLRV